MDQKVEKLLYSKQGAAEALSLSVRSIDYLITTRRLPMRRVGAKVMMPANAVRRFAREDPPGAGAWRWTCCLHLFRKATEFRSGTGAIQSREKCWKRCP